MRQRDRLKGLILGFCNQQGSRTFTLKQIHDRFGNYGIIGIGGQTPQATVRRLLQELRDEGFLSFLDKSGFYTLRGVEWLDSELSETNTLDISGETPERKEYLVESYVRKTMWAKTAREFLGSRCLIDGCENTFVKPNGELYIEVHHIIPLYQGGEDGLWNLAVLCAHHHKMAHFARPVDVNRVQEFLLRKVGDKYEHVY